MNKLQGAAALLAALISAAGHAAQYQLSNDGIAFTFDDASKKLSIKDAGSGHLLSPKEPFFLTLPDEKVIHAADFKITRVEKQGDTLRVVYAHPDYSVTLTLNVLKGKYASIGYTVAAVGKPREVAKITLFPTAGQSQAPYVDGDINSSPIVADSFFIMPDKPIVNTYAYEATTNLNVELKTPVQPGSPVSYTVSARFLKSASCGAA